MKTINKVFQTILVLPFALCGGIIVAIFIAPIKLTTAIIKDIWGSKDDTLRTDY